MIEHFFEFIYDRQEIWHKRNVMQLAAPWSSDPVFQTYKFCNVYRELDGGTLALTKYLHQSEIDLPTKLFTIVAYRFFNRRNTIEHLFEGPLNPVFFDFNHFESRFDSIKTSENIFSNAYLISSHPFNAGYRSKDKHVQILLMLDALRPQIHDFCKELRASAPQDGLSIIRKYVPLAGPFLSGQILLDATYCENLVSYSANDFLIVGPGAHWGLNILFERKQSPSEADSRCRYLHSVQQEQFATLFQQKGKNWQSVKWQNPDYCGKDYLCLHDIQNSLCEFRKYWRLKQGEKAKKRYF